LFKTEDVPGTFIEVSGFHPWRFQSCSVAAVAPVPGVMQPFLIAQHPRGTAQHPCGVGTKD
jgi:hypothetical protein